MGQFLKGKDKGALLQEKGGGYLWAADSARAYSDEASSSHNPIGGYTN
jgi:hypothetical protein